MSDVPNQKAEDAPAAAPDRTAADAASPAPAGTEAPGVEAKPEAAPAPEAAAKPFSMPALNSAPPVESKAAAAPEATAGRPAAAEESSSLFRRRTTLQSPRQALQAQLPPAPPAKKKRKEGTLSAMSGFLSFLLLLLVAGAFGLIAGQHKLKEPGPLPADKVVYIPPRSDVPEILAQLERENVIDSTTLMSLALLAEGSRGKLKPGEYLFKRKASLREVMDELIAGRQILHAVTIPEGLTSEQIVQRLRENDVLVGDLSDTPKEGALLPETYKVARGYPRSKLVAKMQDDQRRLIDQIWAKRARDLPLKTPYELVTLASIVEKETGKAEERPHVAAVFVNRLRKGMRLQSDPTIVYGLVGGKATLGRGIMRAEIDKWTPYNTYAIDGLPPGPIANPGKAALEAAANPLKSPDLYFVADGTGGHVFAETLDQHARNVQHWRAIEHEQKDKAGVAEPVDRLAPTAAPPPPAPKTDRRGDAGFGRLVDAAGRHEDYPAGREMAADDGPTHRLGRYGPDWAAFLLGGYEDPTATNRRVTARLRAARPFFTEAAAQPRLPKAIDPALLAIDAAPAPENESEGVSLMAREGPDGRALPESAGDDIASYPVSATRRAEQKARAARLGLSVGSDELPAEAIGARTPAGDEAGASPAIPPTALAPATKPMRPRAFDASEGTALDPLRDKSWDLTSAKTVPSAASFR